MSLLNPDGTFSRIYIENRVVRLIGKIEQYGSPQWLSITAEDAVVSKASVVTSQSLDVRSKHERIRRPYQVSIMMNDRKYQIQVVSLRDRDRGRDRLIVGLELDGNTRCKVYRSRQDYLQAAERALG